MQQPGRQIEIEFFTTTDNMKTRSFICCFCVVLLALGLAHGQSSSGKQCSNAVPGLDKMAHGIDITTFDLFSTNEGLKNQVVQFTCDLSRADRVNGVSYDLPDQIETVTDIPGGMYNTRTRLVKTYSDARAFISENLGGGGLLGKLGFSASRTLTSMHNTIVNQSRYIELVSACESARRAHMAPDFMLQGGRNFQYYVDNLLASNFDPRDNRSSALTYQNFIGYFGTHYFQNANFGGVLLVEMQTSKDYYFSHSENQVKVQAEASFFNVLKASGGRSTSTTTIDEQFTKMTSVSTRYFGGTTNLLSSGGLQSWQSTVSSAPWLFSGQLAPLTNLIRDTTKRDSMDRAITDYVLRAHLVELSNLISGRLQSWTSGKSKLQALQRQVNNIKSRPLLTVDDVQPLTDEVHSQATIPQWFSSDTQLCYEWYPEGDGGQCSGAQRRLCASPGEMTSEYRDDSDRRSGGCMMSWGIRTSNSDAWFNEVQVCYRWHAEEDAGQCHTNVANGEFCAPVNAMTQPYRDDTDRRSGGCQMSWRLIVPSSAPAWAENLKFCFHWRAEEDGGQCGGGADRELCAVAGLWTANYRDDTDRRPGGCQLSWGIIGPA